MSCRIMPAMKRWACSIVAMLAAAIFLFSAWNVFASHCQIRRCESGVLLVCGAWNVYDPDRGLRHGSDAFGSPTSLSEVQLGQGRGRSHFSLLGFEIVNDGTYW